MARDFRPKNARVSNKGAAAGASSHAGPSSAAKSMGKDKKLALSGKNKVDSDEQDSESTDASEPSDIDSDDDEALLREIKAMGGDESDLQLIRGGQEANALHDTRDDDPSFQSDLISFMKGLDYKGAGQKTPLFDATKRDAKIDADAQAKALDKARAREADAKARKEEKAKKEEKTKRAKEQAKAVVESDQQTLVQAPQQTTKSTRNKFLFLPTPRWSEAELPALPSTPSTSAPSKTSSNDVVARLQSRAEILLSNERAHYSQQMSSGNATTSGMLSTSDARFISQLLAPGARGGTLSDRIAALTLLAQSSPLHNFEAMETLLGMSQKKGREESSRATRALADWLASGGGLSERKLRYFRDHPSVKQIASIDQSSITADKKAQQVIEVHLLVAAFEDKLKRFYFEFLKVLETQTHDTLPFMRNQAVTQVFFLLRDKAEQEQNLLRLLVNKLGDSDRGVASKASNHILSLLTIHPNMKNVVTNEVSNLVMRAPKMSDQEGKGVTNMHARYFGILTLNQTMLTDDDEVVAKRLISLYFDLFEGILQEMDKSSGGKEEVEEDATKRDKGRWRNAQKGQAKSRVKGKRKAKSTVESSNAIADADSKVVAAILSGVRRALPFAKIEGAIIDKHMDTLFRITHCSTFNIALQALQLIFQVCLAGQTMTLASSSSGTQDRFYRALYASLLDPRLATTSKQAMYLNLLFKAVKSDPDNARTKAFVKRLTQLLGSSEPPLVCGSIYLLGELFIAKPELRTLLNDAEDDGDEHFEDAFDEDISSDEQMGKAAVDASSAAKVSATVYDGFKREPRYAKAETTCLWEIVPLLSHFHPSVSLCATQLLTSQKISTSADLTLHSLSHFLDRFVYRNPKKAPTTGKGASLMQPAMHASGDGGRIGLESGVVRLKGSGIGKDEYVNSASFWRKNVEDVPADQLFFHKYFNLKRHGNIKDDMDQEDEQDAEHAEESGDDGDEAEERSDRAHEDSDDEEDSAEEEEIWKAMKASMPREKGDEALNEEEDEDDDESDLDPELMASSDEDDDEQDQDVDDEEETDDQGPDFEEDEDDLVPFSFGDDAESGEEEEEGKERGAHLKRKADDDEDEADGDADENGKPKSNSQKRRAEQKKRKAMPTFASADDYAHLLGDE